MIGDIVYANVSGYQGVYVVANKIGNRFLLSKPDIPNFTLLVSLDKISWKKEN